MTPNGESGEEGELTLEVVGIIDLPDGLISRPGFGQGVDARLPQRRHEHLAGEGRDPGGRDDHFTRPECRQLSSQIGAHVIVHPANSGPQISSEVAA